jgi:nucleotide-binding universal stress UspA family protein
LPYSALSHSLAQPRVATRCANYKKETDGERFDVGTPTRAGANLGSTPHKLLHLAALPVVVVPPSA